MSQINIIFYRMTKEQPIVNELSNYYGSSGDYNVKFIGTDAEASQFIPAAGNGILIFEVKTKVDLQAAVNVLKDQKKMIKNTMLKPACILHINNKKVEKILANYGCVDLLDKDIRSKTFSFKIDFWSRALKTLIESQNVEKLKNKSAENDSSKTDGTVNRENFVFRDSLNLQSDIWLIKSKSDCKRILRRWLVRSLGPSPHTGNWVEVEPQQEDKLPTWKYTLEHDDGQFIFEDGSWFFYGSKPEFDWKLKRWNFSSELPRLYFYTIDKRVFSRFKYIGGIVEVSENSLYAEEKEELIFQTCEINFASEVNEAEGKDYNNQDPDFKPDQMNNSSSTDETHGSNLSSSTNPEDEQSRSTVDKGEELEASLRPSHQLTQPTFDYSQQDGKKNQSYEGSANLNSSLGYEDSISNVAKPLDKKRNEPQSLEAKSGAELWADETSAPKEKSLVLPDHEKEVDMEEALSGGLAEVLNKQANDNLAKEAILKQVINNNEAHPNTKEKIDLSKLLENDPQVDTESGELKVIIKQETKAGNDITFICEFEDFYTDELIVQAPKDSLPLNSQIKGKVSLKYNNEKVNVIIEGNITEIEEFDDRKDTLIIEVNNINEKDYEEFISLYHDRQESITDFLDKAKGL